MRHISSYIRTALNSGAAKLCRAWIIERKDGEKHGFTDHDRSITLEGVACSASFGFNEGASHAELGLDHTSDASIMGVLNDAHISEQDINLGLYDEAIIKAFVVAWDAPTHYVFLKQYRVLKLELGPPSKTGEARFIAHCEGMGHALNRIIGRPYSPLCDAQFGDRRCGLNLSQLPTNTTCDKHQSSCRNFGNLINFRGFAEMPGEDILTLYPRMGQKLDGASLQS